MDKIAQVDYKRIPFNAMPVEDLAQYPDVNRNHPTGYVFAVWFHGEPTATGYGLEFGSAVEDLFRKNDND